MTRRSVVSRFACVALLLATRGVAESTLDPAAQASPVTRETPDTGPVQTAESILANQPAKLVDRLMKKKLIVMQEVREEGSLRGGLVSSYVIFDMPIERVYKLLSQSARQVEFRPELTSIETIEYLARGPVDEQRLKILFRRYVYRLEYRLYPEKRRIEWLLDHRFDNAFTEVVGSWDLYEMNDSRTLGRSGTSIDVGPAIPAFLQDWVTRKNIPKAMKRVRRWVNSDGTYRP